MTHVDQREETVTAFPLGHATVSGLSVMAPPHAKPTQPSDTGAMIWSNVSKGAVLVSGTATRKIRFDAVDEYST